MGMMKARIYPRDITLNLGREAPVPGHPYPGQQWKEVRHDKTVTWLAFWKDTISDKVRARCLIMGSSHGSSCDQAVTWLAFWKGSISAKVRALWPTP